jgi:hypothetical protein
MGTLRLLLLGLTSAVACVACASPSWPTLEPTGDPAQDLARHRARFADAVGDNYRLTYENSCFCPVEALQPVRLTVRNGEITEVYRRSDGAAVPASQWLAYRTVPAVFDAIADGLQNRAKQVTVDYHARYGYPQDVLVDYNMAADAFVGFRLRDLEPLR